jgi:HEPN domain-containing protein
MKKLDIKKIVNYWKATAEHDYETMLSLFKSKRYYGSLFFGHVVLEKILKAHVVRTTEKEAPKIHNLARLQELAGIEISREEKDLLYQVNEFNIRTRYPDYKFIFYKQCTKEYTKHYLEKIKKLYAKLCLKLKQKK